MAIKKTQGDNWFSKCVRIRANWNCEYCGNNFENDKGMLHCSHFISRGYLATRYHPFNALSHCHSCHDKLGGGRWGGGNVAEFAAHYDQVFSEQARELVRRLSQCQFRKHKLYIPEIASHYRKIYKEMDQMRMDGNQNRIEFEFFTGSLELNALVKECLT